MREVKTLIGLLGTRGSTHRKRLTAVSSGEASMADLYLTARYLDDLRKAVEAAQKAVDAEIRTSAEKRR